MHLVCSYTASSRANGSAEGGLHTWAGAAAWDAKLLLLMLAAPSSSRESALALDITLGARQAQVQQLASTPSAAMAQCALAVPLWAQFACTR